MLVASIVIVSTAGAGAVYAHSQSSAAPKIIYFNRLQTSCDANWTCLGKAAKTVRHPVLGPDAGEAAGPLTADGSPLTDESILSYAFTPIGQSATVLLYARAGHDSAMRDVLPPADAVTNGEQVTVAGQQGYIATLAGQSNLWVTLDGMHYRFTSADPDDAIMQAVASNLVAVDR